MKRHLRGIIAVVVILMIMALAAIVFSSDDQGFLQLYQTDGVQTMPGLSSGYSQAGVGIPW